jgi:hypothetical protein
MLDCYREFEFVARLGDPIPFSSPIYVGQKQRNVNGAGLVYRPFSYRPFEIRFSVP